jgi:hypothetical protein
LLPMLEISGDQTIPELGSLQYLVDNAPSIQLRKIDGTSNCIKN